MNTVCENDMCAGCYACVNVCKVEAIKIVDDGKCLNASIDPEKCIKCGKCGKICPVTNSISLYKPQLWLEAWANDDIRKQSSSGGAATALALEFINRGGYVCACVFREGNFQFAITNDKKEILKFAGSKYIKSSPRLIYNQIKEHLLQKHSVLFIGLPCQVAAARKITSDDPLLTTIDLICHGSPSETFLDLYLKEKKIKLKNTKQISFRDKENFNLTIDGKQLVPNRVTDSYTRAFLMGLDYTDNCYSCKYAQENRGADITLGDSWGADPALLENGVSLILCQTPKGIELVERAGLHVQQTDRRKALDTNHQLVAPSTIHPKRDAFYKRINKGDRFSKAVFIAAPTQSVKHCIKYTLSKLGLL